MLNQNIVRYNVHDMHRMQNDIYKKTFNKKQPNTHLENLNNKNNLTGPNDVYLFVYDNKYYRTDLIPIR